MAVLAWCWAEVVHHRSSGRLLGTPRDPLRHEVVVVLGFRNPGVTVNAINRYRVRAGLRSLDPAVPSSTLVLSGGAVGGPTAEAVLMAGHARRLGYRGRLVVEDGSVTTWDNVRAWVKPLAAVRGSRSLRRLRRSPLPGPGGRMQG